MFFRRAVQGIKRLGRYFSNLPPTQDPVPNLRTINCPHFRNHEIWLFPADLGQQFGSRTWRCLT